MGAALGDALSRQGHDVLWASEGRSDATHARAAAFRDAGTGRGARRRAPCSSLVCPPHAAVELRARSPASRPLRRRERDLACDGARGRRAARRGSSTAASSAHRRGRPARRAVPVGRRRAAPSPGCSPARSSTRASSRTRRRSRWSYAAWSKGTAALLLAIRDVARATASGTTSAEWRASAPELLSGSPRRALRGGEGLALDRRDGGDRRHVRRRRRSPRGSTAPQPRSTAGDPRRGASPSATATAGVRRRRRRARPTGASCS